MTHSPTERGFTLIEMLVALSVFAIAALALLRLDGFAVATAADLDSRMVAELVVHNEAALLATDSGPVVRGVTSRSVTNAGRAFSVRRTIAPTADRRLVRADILATERGGRARAALTVVRRVE